jgi:hypothetical protein
LGGYKEGYGDYSMSDLPKTLYVILNHNVGGLTTRYYEELKWYQEQDNFDLLLIDNGSKFEHRSVHTTHQFKKNVYFNGAIQWAFKYMLDHPEYEWLVFSNNDLIIHGYRFVETMITAAQEGDFTMIAPSGIEGNAGQNFWPIMHCWYKKETRVVPWIDFICPFIHRRLIDEIKQFPTWWKSPSYGFDDYCAIMCNRKGWKIGVSDLVTTFHYGQMSYRKELADDGLDLYTMQNKHRHNFDWNFAKSGLQKEQKELDTKKALYGRNNSLKMGRMPATPDEGYYDTYATAVERQWFRNEEEKELYDIRQTMLEDDYLKKKNVARIKGERSL